MAHEIDLDEPRFSQTFELPADPASNREKPLKVTYADFGYRGENEHVFLFFGSMTASRWLHVGKDYLAKAYKIRFINVDRPGFDGSEEVDVAHRIDICRSIYLELIRHLGIRHVTLGAHSGGIVYALDLALHHPEILDPEKPYIAIAGPWVLPSHSGSIIMSIVQTLPAALIRSADGFSNLMNNYIGPAIGKTFGVSQIITAAFVDQQDDQWSKDMEEVDKKYYRFERSYFRDSGRQMSAASTRGLNDEGLVLMQKPPAAPGGWGDWGDFDVLVPRLAEHFRSAGKTLKVDVLYGESDSLIGTTKGPAWFDACWQASDVKDVVDYSRSVVKGADHDSIWDSKYSTCRKAFEYISGIKEEEAAGTGAE